MSSRYGELIELGIKKNIKYLTWQCTGCCYADECEADAGRDFSRYCENIIEAAIREETTFKHPTQRISEEKG